jgi:hypothetical protein
MTNLIPLARPAVEKLDAMDEDSLYLQLGSRLTAISRSPEGSEKFDMPLGPDLVAYGPLDTLKELGRKFFQRWNQAAYNLMCGGSADDASLRQRLSDAFGLGKDAVIATLAASLVAYFGLAAGLAGVIAAIAVKLFFRPGYQAMCDVWKTKV